VVGADGIRSSAKVAHWWQCYPLRSSIVWYWNLSLAVLNGIDSSLLDSATVFQTANGNERIYIMPMIQNQ
jgi:hypothetical protein